MAENRYFYLPTSVVGSATNTFSVHEIEIDVKTLKNFMADQYQHDNESYDSHKMNSK